MIKKNKSEVQGRLIRLNNFILLVFQAALNSSTKSCLIQIHTTSPFIWRCWGLNPGCSTFQAGVLPLSCWPFPPSVSCSWYELIGLPIWNSLPLSCSFAMYPAAWTSPFAFTFTFTFFKRHFILLDLHRK